MTTYNELLDDLIRIKDVIHQKEITGNSYELVTLNKELEIIKSKVYGVLSFNVEVIA